MYSVPKIPPTPDFRLSAEDRAYVFALAREGLEVDRWFWTTYEFDPPHAGPHLVLARRPWPSSNSVPDGIIELWIVSSPPVAVERPAHTGRVHDVAWLLFAMLNTAVPPRVIWTGTFTPARMLAYTVTSETHAEGRS